MSFGIIVLMRILFAACMVFIIGYVFGNFSKNPQLVTITRVASILAIVLFISANVFLFRVNGRHGYYHWRNCNYEQRDSIGK